MAILDPDTDASCSEFQQGKEKMKRKALVVGDPPICGGRVLPYEPPFAYRIDGHQVALIGGRVYCEGCNSIGIIGKAGGP